jgi:membrane protein implicated in regulation of membrane protease activity
MEWSAATLWWVAAGVLVAAELASGTFHLLMLALGCAAGALASHLGLASTAQIVTAAVVGGGSTALWHVRRMRAPKSAPSESNRDVNLDIGQTVQVDGWNTDGSARVNYRGAAWSVRYSGEGAPQPGRHVIVAVQGNQLQVARAR